MKKLVTLLMSVVLLIGGCTLLENKNSREYMEKHFSYLEKVYPTRNVEELFEKSKNNIKIVYTIANRNTNESGLIVRFFELTVDIENKRIYGTEKKEKLVNNTSEIIYDENVEYKNGYIVYPDNNSLEPNRIIFLFEQLSYEQLKEYKVRSVEYENQRPTYILSYWLPESFYEKLNFPIDNVQARLRMKDTGRRNAELEIALENTNVSILERIEGDLFNE